MKISLFGKEITKKRLKNAYVLFNMRQGRGSGYLARFQELFYLVSVGSVSVKILGINLPYYSVLMIGILYMVITYQIGFYDETKWKIWQIQEEKQTSYINPYYQRLETNIEELKEMMTKSKKKSLK